MEMARKKGALSEEQVRVFEKRGLDRLLWVVIQDLPGSLIVKHRVTGEFRVIDK